MRRPLDPFDDGGTPAWRARQAAIYEASPPMSHPIAWARAWFRRTSLPRIALLILAAFGAGPFLVLFGGMALMAALGINPG